MFFFMNSRDIAVRIVFCCVMFIPFSSIAQLSNGAASVSGDMEYECYRYLAIGEDFKVQVEGPHLASFSLPDYDFVKLEFLNQLKHLSSRSKRISGQTWVEIIDVQDLDKVHRLESSVLFMNLDILADGSVAANCYDSVHGWQLVFGRIVASGLIADDYRSKISVSASPI